MHVTLESSLSEVPPLRRSLSDPTLTPRKCHQRVGTPYPKKESFQSKIGQFSQNQAESEEVPKFRPCQRSKVLKTEFYPQFPTSTTTLQGPRDLTLSSPESSQLDLTHYGIPGSSPLVQIYKKKIPRAPPPSFIKSQNQKALVICKGLEKLRPSSTTSNSGVKSSKCRGIILDPEGYIQGPHPAHNRRIELHGKDIQIQDSPPIFCDQDRGDFNSNLTKNSLPPLPPNVKTKNPKLRLATATLSQGNTIQDNSGQGPIQISYPLHSRSGLYTPKSAPKKKNLRVNPNPSVTSVLSKVHEAESCTNLHKQLNSESENLASHNCPLCAESKGQCHLHHRTMCSRYMTDLEWRICHAVNIYVYKNGEEGQTPVLVHIPPSKKKNMRYVMSVIQERICYPIGYAKHLYRMNGKKVTNPCELEMYNNYVVASNYDKAFKCVCYARRKSPLLVLAKESKHVRELRLKNYQYELYLAKKRASDDERPNYGNCNTYYTCDSFGPSEMSVGSFLTPSVRASGPLYSSKNYSKRKQRSIVMPALEQMTVNCRGEGPRNGGLVFDQRNTSVIYEQQQQQQQNMRNGPTFVPTNSRNANQSFSRIVGTPILERPRSNVVPMNENLAGNYQQQQYTVNNCTITTAPLKNPAKHAFKNSKEQESLSGRYKGIINDDESLFYSSKKKKTNRGVIDVSGEKKKIFYRESDLNGNLNVDDSDLDYQPQKYSFTAYSTEDQSEGEGSKFKSVNKLDLFSSKESKNDELKSMGGDGENRILKDTAITIIEEEIDLNNNSVEIQQSRVMDEGHQTDSKNDPLQPNSEESQQGQSISAPSRSYTILARPNGNPAQNRHTQVTPLVSGSNYEGKLKEVTNNFWNFNGDQLNSNYQDPNQFLYGTPSPSIYLSRNQTSYTCYPQGGYYVQPTPHPTKLVNQPPIHQIYPVEILNQRPPYHLMDGSRFRPDGAPSFGNCYTSTDEIDIPFTPIYQRALETGPYMQMPFVAGMNQQFSYRGDLQGYTSRNGMGGSLKKPSRRNVAIQMGDPISDSFEGSQGSPRPQQLFYSTPAYYYTPQNPILHSVIPRQNFDPEQGEREREREREGNAENQENNSGVLPPPTRYRDCGLFEHRSSRAFSKPTNNGRGKKDGEVGGNESEFYSMHDNSNSRCVWKKSS